MRPLARVIFDEAHRQAWSTRPEIAKSINPTNANDAGYVTAATDLSDSGFTVGVHETGAITAATLSEADVFVVLHGSDDAWESTTKTGDPKYSDAEIDALVEFVQAGGGLILFGETEAKCRSSPPRAPMRTRWNYCGSGFGR